MPAILVQKGAKYACNFSFDRDHICLQSYLLGTIYACKKYLFRKFLKHLESDRLGSKSYLRIFEIAGIYGLGCSPKANKIIFFQLKMDSSVVLATDFEYMSQSGQFGH